MDNPKFSLIRCPKIQQDYSKVWRGFQTNLRGIKRQKYSFWTRYTHTHGKKKYRPPERRKTASGTSGLYCVVGQDYGKDGTRIIGY